MNIQFSRIKAIIILTMLSMMGLLASDIYLPAMRQMSLTLNASFADVQLTIGIFLFGLSLFQLFYGPISDQIGRKKLIVLGIILYIIGCIGCILSTDLQTLLISRFVQAIGACAGLVLGRAVLADIFPPNEITGIYNIIYPLVAASPAIAPLIGGYLVTYFGWKSNFIFVLFFGIMLGILIINLPETIALGTNKFSIKKLFNDYYMIIKNIRFWGLCTIICAIYGAWFIYLTQSPFIFLTTLHLKPTTIGFFYIPLAVCIYIGNIFSKQLKRHKGTEYALIIGCLFFLAGSVLLFIFSTLFPIVFAMQLIFPMSILAIANGFILPLGIPSAISLNPQQSGSGSGLIGFFQIGFSACCASFIGRIFGTSAITMGASILILTIISFACYIFSKQLSTQIIKI